MTGSKSEMTYRGHITYSTFTYWVSNSNIKYSSHRAYCHTVRSSGDLQYADEFFVIEYFLPDNPTTADIASVFRQGMSANKPNRDLFRRVAEYDVSNGLYDAKFEEVAKVPDNPTSPEFVPGTAPVVSSPSVVAPEPLPSPNPGTNPNPGTSPSPNPGTNPNPGTSPSPNPAPNPSPNPDRSNQQEPEGFSLPSFCSWASFLCFRANEDKKAPEELENFDYNVEEKQLTKNPVDFDVEYLAYGGACPAPIRFDLNVGLVAVPLEYSLTPLCDFAKTVRPAILALAYLTALGIVVSAIRS
ncbi:TspB protein [Moraxella cuniculi DSM 21768]|uniref:TspB protein n=1 Tax=Moraxella cuniculi DSM 21768 TaxID=1122245 RepID=A0A1N7G854_9GAMM|nr:virulence factor TspB C-terminal domain-related protein [Moraxella cuniculi]OOS02663.1 hypothetical protein B0189_10010 [Moraxella cuniculi]SIS08755.1 TspB protein [Moraxella cuniculi DSM 21768]SIS08839.1 TspB protein [Moraxella cuniculi DSM 21768]